MPTLTSVQLQLTGSKQLLKGKYAAFVFELGHYINHRK